MRSTNIDVLKVFYDHVKKYKLAVFTACISSLAVNAFALLPPWLYKLMFDLLSNTSLTLNERAETAMPYLLAIIASKTAVQLCWRGVDFSLIYLESHAMVDIASTSFSYLEKHSYQFFSNSFTGSLVRKVNRLVRSFEELTDKLIFNFIPLFVLTFGALSVITWRQPTIGMIMFAWVFLFVGMNLLLFKKVQKYNLLRAEKDSEVTGVLSDSLTNNVNVKLFSRYDFEESRYAKVLDEWRTLMSKGWKMNILPIILGAISFLILEFAVIYTALHYYAIGALTLGDFVLFQTYILSLITGLWQIQNYMKHVFQAFSDAREMVDILLEPHGIEDSRRAKNLVVPKGGLEFKDVKFSYHKTRTVLKDFGLKVKPGEHVALVGPSGSGKSTIVKLLFRFYDLDKGKILIDDQDIAKCTQDSLRENVALVPQDPVLFHRSLMDNIRYGRLDATDEEVFEASKKANCHDFIINQSSGYQTFVGERGIKLSGGERQRVAIARAILKNAPILVLDEATSSLDSESEALIQDALKTLMRGKTSIVIAHRLSTIMQMDRIVVMQEGRIIDQGTHPALLKRQGMYKKLWEIQAGGFMP
ncbi:ABC transporter ATP-binding protein [Candidatus Uhrbacteria bacterium]|nr:ABC transporter ATP-binding protein [Candidatus Uhrbacteria bacterium]